MDLLAEGGDEPLLALRVDRAACLLLHEVRQYDYNDGLTTVVKIMMIGSSNWWENEVLM